VDAAGRAEKELGTVTRVIKKASEEYALQVDPPPCPSVVVGARLIAANDVVTYEALRAAILSTGVHQGRAS
jgi:hypothetical protein